MSSELYKRIITSIFLLFILLMMLLKDYILLSLTVVISLIVWFEFNNIFTKIFKKTKKEISFKRFFASLIVLIYLFIFDILLISNFLNENKIICLFVLSICICTDIGGLLFGKIFKGKKLIKISPNKTRSGSIGSFILSLLFMILFFKLDILNLNLFDLVVLTIFVSLFSQIGDLLISYLKRKGKIKNTGHILPGHGGFLDRVDGILLGVPVGLVLNMVLF